MYQYMSGAHLYSFALYSSYARIMRTIGFGKRVLTSRGVSTRPRSIFERHRFPSPFDPGTMCEMPSDALNKGKQYNPEYRNFMSNYSGSLVFVFRRPHKDRPPGTKCRCSQLGPKRDNITGYARCEYLKVKPGSMASKNLP
jgi:hypothetical protein